MPDDVFLALHTQFIHSEIQPYNSNAQISINLIPRYSELTDMIRY